MILELLLLDKISKNLITIDFINIIIIIIMQSYCHSIMKIVKLSYNTVKH